MNHNHFFKFAMFTFSIVVASQVLFKLNIMQRQIITININELLHFRRSTINHQSHMTSSEQQK